MKRSMMLPSHLPRRPFPLSRLRLSLSSFHSKPRPKLSPPRDGGCPNLLRHNERLSPPQVIRIFQTLKNPNFALPLFVQLSARNDYNPNESLFSTIINTLARAKNFDDVEALMLKIKVDHPKCRLSDAFFRNLIQIYGRSGRIDQAIKTLNDMLIYKCQPSAATLNCLLNLLLTTKRFEAVREVYMKASKLDVKMDACCLNLFIKALCESKQIEAALKVLDEFPQRKCNPTVRTFSAIMHAMCKSSRVEESFRLLERMEAEGVEADAVVYNILISGLRKQGRAEEGVELLEKMMSKGCDPNAGTYQAVLYCWLDSNEFGEVKKFVERMIEKGVKPSFESYKVMIQGFCRENVVEDVEWGLRKMVSNGFVPNMGMWKRMVQCLHSHKNAYASDFDCVFSGIILTTHFD